MVNGVLEETALGCLIILSHNEVKQEAYKIIPENKFLLINSEAPNGLA